MKKIYIILTDSKTIPSIIIGKYTKKQYNHVSISLDKSLQNMYSFGRRNIHTFIYSGFITAGMETKKLKNFNETTCEIYELEISLYQYEKLKSIINHFKENDKMYGYNYIGLLFCIFNKNLHRTNAYFCSQFISYLLYSINVIDDMDEYLIPNNIKDIDNMKLIYKGYLADYEQYTYSFYLNKNKKVV